MPNADQKDLDGDGQGNVCDDDDAPLVPTATRLKIGAGKGAVSVRGYWQLAPSGDAFDLANGVAIEVRDGGVTSQTHVWTPGECAIATSGRMKCRSFDRHATVTIKPSKVTAGLYGFAVQWSRVTIAGPLAAPTTVRLTHGAGIDRVGTVSFCRGSATTLRCK